MEEIATNPTVELPELTQDWEIDSWRAQQNFVHQDPGERSSDPTGDCARLAVSVQEPPAEPWVGDGLLRVGTLSVAGHSWDLLKELTIIFITSTIVWPQVNSQEGTQPHPSTENWINKAGAGDGIPLELLQILKDDAVKVLHSKCQQIWKTQQWPQDWKSQFSFQSQRKAMPKNAQTMTQLHSSHTLVKECSKFSKPGFSNT